MLQIARTQIPFSLEHGSLDEHRQKYESAEKIKVRILVDKQIARYINNSRKHYGFVSEKVKGNQVEMTFMVSDVEQGFPRWYLMFGDYAEILEPEDLRRRIKELLERTKMRL